MQSPFEQMLKQIAPSEHLLLEKQVNRIANRFDLLVATVTVVGGQWLIDSGHPYFGWGLIANNFLTGLYIVGKELRK